ncbi:hypothetical protein Tco_1204020 [Tanacetum coccineum]
MCMFAHNGEYCWNEEHLRRQCLDSAWIKQCRMNFISSTDKKSCESSDKTIGQDGLLTKVMLGRGYCFEESFAPVARWKQFGFSLPTQHTNHPEKVYLLRKAVYGLKQAQRADPSEVPNKDADSCRNALILGKGTSGGTVPPSDALHNPSAIRVSAQQETLSHLSRSTLLSIDISLRGLLIE